MKITLRVQAVPGVHVTSYRRRRLAIGSETMASAGAPRTGRYVLDIETTSRVDEDNAYVKGGSVIMYQRPPLGGGFERVYIGRSFRACYLDDRWNGHRVRVTFTPIPRRNRKGRKNGQRRRGSAVRAGHAGAARRTVARLRKVRRARRGAR